jgi:hypothetical protein
MGSMGQVPVDPVRDTRATTFLVGLGLVGAGLVLGGAGFAILYVCREGQECHADQTLRTVGWVLAAPGIIPLGVGLLLLYVSSGGRGGTHAASALSSLTVSPLPGGAFVSGGLRF